MTAPPSPFEPPVFLDRRIPPRRSLSREGMMWLFGGLVLWNAVVCGVLLLIGAWPVPVFLGLDVVALAAAFAAQRRGAAGGERVRVTAVAVTVERDGGRRRPPAVWRSAAAWTQVLRPDPQGRSPPRLSGGGDVTVVGAALPAAERLELARALESAIAAARRACW